jgi:hypothetical protein
MAASTASLAPTNSSNANFRLWVSAFIAALVAGGLVRVAQTGEIDESTVTVPGANYTKAGFVIFRSNDATGGLHNWFIKISFGRGGSANYPSLWYQFGWGSDGAGNLTGNTNTEVQNACSNDSATLMDCNFCAHPGSIHFALFVLDGSFATILNVERVRDTNGAVTDDIHVFCNMSTAVRINQTVRYSGTHSSNNTSPTVSSNGSGWRHPLVATASYAGNTGVGALAPQLGAFYPECLGLFSGDTTTFTTGQQTYTFTVYGASRTYILNATSTLGNSVYRILTRYD